MTSCVESKNPYQLAREFYNHAGYFIHAIILITMLWQRMLIAINYYFDWRRADNGVVREQIRLVKFYFMAKGSKKF
jgi:hypothetical protein